MVGLGWWGKTLVESVDGSDAIRFVAATTRTVTPSVEEAATSRGLRLVPSYDELLADPGVDAVVLATPPSVHTEQVVAAAAAASMSSARSRSRSPGRRPSRRSRRAIAPR